MYVTVIDMSYIGIQRENICMLHYSLFRCITRIELLKLVFVNHRTKLYLNENFKLLFGLCIFF